MAKKKAPKTCYFTDNQVRPDYKDYQTLKAFMSPQAKIVAKRRTGTRSSQQRELTQAIKRARFLAIVPFVTR